MARIVFIGAVEFSRHCLQEILHQKANVVAVFNPEAQDARFNSDYADLAEMASNYDVPLHRFRKIGDSETISTICNYHPDWLFVLGLSQLIPTELLKVLDLDVLAFIRRYCRATAAATRLFGL